MATFNEIKQLAKAAVTRKLPKDIGENYSLEDVNGALRDALNELGGSINRFMKNRYDIYEIMVEAVDEVVPNKVVDALGAFAEIRQVPQGQKTLFKTTLGKDRAKKFITRVGLSGVYETFRLDNTSFEVPVHAIGGAATVDFERVLDGAENFAEVADIVAEGIVDATYGEVQRALKAALTATGRPAANFKTTNGFDSAKMMSLISVVKAYGRDAVIFAPPEFVAAMGPDQIVSVAAAGKGIYHPQDIDAIHNTGYVNIFRGTPIVQIPQSFVNTQNEKTQIDPQLAYVLPTGGEKVVKVVFEGNTQVYDWQNKDQSMEINMYRKLGAAVLTHYNWGIYQNTGIEQTLEEAYPNV